MRLILAGLSEPGRQASRPSKTVFAVVALAAGLLVSPACEKVPLLAPSLTTITLSAASTIVQANGSTEISATLLEQSGTPVQNGTVVTFSTTLGTIEPREARTFNGTATVRFIATGQSGEAEIRAASGGAKPADPASPSIKIKVGAAAAARIQVTANPSRVSASGGSSSITAIVSDTNGNPLSGIPVAFTTDAGDLSSSSAMTSSNGEAQVTLSTNRKAIVTATTGATSGTTAISGTVSVSVTSPPTLTLEVAPAAPIEDQPVLFTLTVGPISDTTDPLQSVVVSFGDGASTNLGALTAGTTRVSHVYTSDGTYTVRATGTGSTGDTTVASAVIVVSPSPSIGVSLATSGTKEVGEVITFTADAKVPTGTSVDRYEWTFGDGGRETTTGGSVSHVYTAAGTYTARVRVVGTTGGTGTAQTILIIAP